MFAKSLSITQKMKTNHPLKFNPCLSFLSLVFEKHPAIKISSYEKENY